MSLGAYLDRVRLLAELAVAPDFHALTVADVEHLVFRQRSVPGFPVDGDMLGRARFEGARLSARPDRDPYPTEVTD